MENVERRKKFQGFNRDGEATRHNFPMDRNQNRYQSRRTVSAKKYTIILEIDFFLSFEGCIKELFITTPFPSQIVKLFELISFAMLAHRHRDLYSLRAATVPLFSLG